MTRDKNVAIIVEAEVARPFHVLAGYVFLDILIIQTLLTPSRLVSGVRSSKGEGAEGSAGGYSQLITLASA